MDEAAAKKSINAVKGVNMGSGRDPAMLTGEENSEEIKQRKGKTSPKSNKAGGMPGGMPTGQEIKISAAGKPTPPNATTRKTKDKAGKNTTRPGKGRHDPCGGIRAVPIGEAKKHGGNLDHYLMNTAQNKI
jgi:Chorismate synthase